MLKHLLFMFQQNSLFQSIGVIISNRALILYDINRVSPESQWVFNFNPMVHIIAAYRDILIEGVLPDWSYLLGGLYFLRSPSS